MSKRFLAGAALAAAVLAGAASAAIPVPKPPDFSARVTNPWFPLRPGTTWVYRGVKDGMPSRDVVRVTSGIRTIQGVPCVVVDDRLYLNGRLRERTSDWYSQDRTGNVWYFGEATAELDAKGHVTSRSGSWEAGVAGARPGIIMFARPRVGRTAQTEYRKGEAADFFQVLSLRASVTVPYLTSHAALLTKEWTPLEPGTLDHKKYVRGLGMVFEETVKGGNERSSLVSVSKP